MVGLDGSPVSMVLEVTIFLCFLFITCVLIGVGVGVVVVGALSLIDLETRGKRSILIEIFISNTDRSEASGSP